MHKKKRRDILLGVGSSLFGLLLLLVIIPQGIPTTARQAVANPRTWPEIIGFLIIGFGIWVLIEAMSLPSNAFAEDARSAPDADRAPRPWRLLVICLLLLLPYLIVGWVGIIGASIALVLVFTVPFGERRLLVLALLVSIPVLSYYFFTRAASVQFPLGVFG